MCVLSGAIFFYALLSEICYLLKTLSYILPNSQTNLLHASNCCFITETIYSAYSAYLLFYLDTTLYYNNMIAMVNDKLKQISLLLALLLIIISVISEDNLTILLHTGYWLVGVDIQQIFG